MKLKNNDHPMVYNYYLFLKKNSFKQAKKIILASLKKASF